MPSDLPTDIVHGDTPCIRDFTDTLRALWQRWRHLTQSNNTFARRQIQHNFLNFHLSVSFDCVIAHQFLIRFQVFYCAFAAEIVRAKMAYERATSSCLCFIACCRIFGKCFNFCLRPLFQNGRTAVIVRNNGGRWYVWFFERRLSNCKRCSENSRNVTEKSKIIIKYFVLCLRNDWETDTNTSPHPSQLLSNASTTVCKKVVMDSTQLWVLKRS